MESDKIGIKETAPTADEAIISPIDEEAIERDEPITLDSAPHERRERGFKRKFRADDEDVDQEEESEEENDNEEISEQEEPSGDNERHRLIENLEKMIFRGIVKPEDLAILENSKAILDFIARLQSLSITELKLLRNMVRVRMTGSVGNEAVTAIQNGAAAILQNLTGDAETCKELREDKTVTISLDDMIGDTLDSVPAPAKLALTLGSYVGRAFVNLKLRKLNDGKAVEGQQAPPSISAAAGTLRQ